MIDPKSLGKKYEQYYSVILRQTQYLRQLSGVNDGVI
jgi:hypothetical protein